MLLGSHLIRNHTQKGPRRAYAGPMIAAFSITPLGAGESVAHLVADAVRIVRESGLPSETNAMFTNLEGEWDEVMAVIKQCVERVAEEVPRVSVVIKIDHRPGTTDAIHEKVRSIEELLGGAEGAT